jgi:uncharacterized protein YndB with AHSA1/START domain
VARYTFSRHIDAPVEAVFDLWTNVDRLGEWVGGVTRVSDVSGQTDVVGTRYTVWFGGMKSPTEVIAVERPNRFATHFGNFILRGRSIANFQPDGSGTLLTQTFETEGLVPAITARLFATGSYRGSFRGELEAFARIAERDARAESARSRPP